MNDESPASDRPVPETRRNGAVGVNPDHNLLRGVRRDAVESQQPGWASLSASWVSASFPAPVDYPV